MITLESRSAYVHAMAAAAQIEATGMFVANQQAHRDGTDPPYTKDDFDGVITKYGIHHNSIVSFLNGAGL